MAAEQKKKSEVKYHSNVQDFVPYAAHFDEETLISKNGELIQVIKITGFGFELIKDRIEEQKPLRELIRKAILNNVKDNSYAIWMHTIRREADISAGGYYKEKFASDINEKWIKENNWRSQFINELYITIIKQGESLPFKDPRGLVGCLFPKKEIEARNKTLLENHKALKQVVSGITEGLSEFGARKLSVYKKEGIYYSEIISLLSKIMNLKEEEIPLAPYDLSAMLPTKTVSFQYNSVQVEGETKKHYGAVYSLKEYREITLDELDKLIQLPVNLIVTQSFCFVDKSEALEAFEDQKKIYKLSNSKYMADISGINEIFDENANEKIGYGEQQITITVLEDTIRGLQNSAGMVVDVLRDMGLFSVREDLFMENCYWSAMPANFDFTNRKTFLPFQKIAGFASVYNFTTGKLDNNKWGRALTTFKTAKGMPYFFNFHYEKSGHTIIVSDAEDERETLVKFLVSQAQKYGGKTLFVETQQKSDVFTRLLGGRYIQKRDLESFFKEDTTKVAGMIVSADLAELIECLRTATACLSGDKPTTICIDNTLTSLSCEDGATVAQLLNDLTEKNAITLLGAKEGLTDKNQGIFKPEVIDLIETKIFLPNDKADYNYKEVFKIKGKELTTIKELAPDELVVKRHNDSVVIRFGSKAIRKLLSVTKDSTENKEAINAAITEAMSEDTERWLPLYFSKKNL